MVKTEDLLLLGVGAFILFKGIPDIGSIFGDIFGLAAGRQQIVDVTAAIQTETENIKALTEDVKGMQAALEEHEVIGAEIMEIIDRVEAGIEALKQREQFAYDAYQTFLESTMEEAVAVAVQEPALADLYERDPASLEWLIRNMPYAVGGGQ